MMERNTRQRITAALFIALFLGSGVGAGVDLAKIDDAHGSSSVAAAAGGLDDVERLFEGGGTQVHFADDMSQRMADHYEAMDYLEDGLPFDYYGGGAPTAGSDDMWAWQAERWELDPYRWGHEGAQRLDSDEVLDEPWSWSPGSWRFGSDEGYPTGAMAGLVTPVVDLRDVPRSEGLDVDIKSGTTPSTAFGVSSLFGLGVTPPSGNAQANASAPKPTAVLRLEHAYDFLWAITANGQRLVDGGRVEIAYLDSVEGWSSWQGIQPSSEMLRIGDTTFQGRTAQGTSSAGVAAGADAQEPAVTVDPEGPSASAEPGTINATADAWYRDAQAGSARNGVGFDSASGSPSTTVLASPPRPAWLYGGVVDASQDRDLLGGPWRGFGGVSNGTVESVFDLSAYAGHMVRMRFVTATKEANLNTTAHAGWDLRGVEVHAVQSQGTSILDLAAPGDGAILGDGASFAPVAVFENRRSAPRQATATIDIDGSTATEPLEIPPAGRVFHRFPAFDDIVPAEARPGLHRVDVSLTEREVLAPPPEAPVPDEQDVGVDGSTRTASFHFQLGGGSDWRVVSVDFKPISDEGFGSDRLILPGTPAKITVGLENLGPVDLTLDLEDDIAPVLRDLRGEPVEAMQESRATIDLPVSRSVSGSLGQADPVVFAEWTWDGTDDRQVLDLRVEDSEGTVRFDAGRVRVGAMEPEAMNITFANTWDFDDGCIRSATAEGRAGVIRCRGWGNATSPIYKVDGGRDLLVGSRSNLRIMHHGGPVNATLLALNHSDYSIFNAALPAEDAPEWTMAYNASLPESTSWSPQRIPWHTFPTNATTDQAWSGWIMLRFGTNSTGSWSADEVRLEVGPADRALPIVWETLDVGLHPQDGTLTSPSKQPMARLNGRDGVPLDACLEDAGIGGSGLECDGDYGLGRYVVDEGDLHSDTWQTTGLGSQSYPTGRLVQDSILRLDEPIDMAGARPTLHFYHWLDANPGGTAFVEVARASALSSSDAFQSATDHTPGAAAEADEAWQAVATYEGEAGGSELRVAEVPLDAFVGEEVLVRFRYHIDPSTDFTEIPRGWFVDGVRVSTHTLDGIQEIPVALTEATASAGITFDDTFEGIPNGASGGDDQPVTLGFVGRDQCASGARIQNAYDRGPTAISDAVDLRSASQPILTLNHSLNRPAVGLNSVSGPGPHMMIDLEYQEQHPDGTWPSTWERATPHIHYVPSQQNRAGATWLGQPLPSPGALPGEDGQPVMDPFIDRGTAGWERFDTTFVLNQLAGEVVRFRVHVWTEAFWWADRATGTICELAPDVWRVHGISIREPIHLTDAAVTGLNVLQDDSDLVSRLGGTQIQVPRDVQVLFQDDARVVVDVTNKGKLPVALNVTLGATPRGDTEPPALFFIDDFTNPDNPTPTFNPWGFVPEIAPGETVQVRFQADFTTTEPGAYDLNAVARAVGAVDTKPTNDAASQTMLVQPLRALSVDPATTVEPFIGVSSSQRNLTVVLRNEGNVREREVLVEATLLRMTSLTEGVPVEGVALPSKLATQLDARVGVTPPDMLRWNLDPAAAGLTPDESYAIEVRVTPEPGSARMSLPDGSTQPLEPADGVLLDLTDIGKCANVEEPGQGCRLVRFLVEDHLYGTDFTPANSTSAVPGILPVDKEGVLAGWTATTRVRDGEGWIEVEPGERPGVPSWSLGNATDVSAMPILRDGPAVEGGATGKVWYVPPYDGLEDVENELRSPVLPGHIIDDASRGIVDLRYASGLEEGQADLEVRTLEGGAWSEWMPSSSTRAGRVAVVLPPDFPRVQRSDIGPGWTASGVTTGLAQSPSAERDVTVFPLVENGVEQWHLIAGLTGNSPRFWGYTWNPALGQWASNNTIVNNLASQSFPAPAAFDLEGETYLLVGASNAAITGFRWTGSQWVADDNIEAGIQPVSTGYGDPVVFHMEGQTYLIIGSNGGSFAGYRWDGSQWVEDQGMTAGIPAQRRGAPAVFRVEGPEAGTYLVTGGRGLSNNCPPTRTFRWSDSGWAATPMANPIAATTFNQAPTCTSNPEFRPATIADPVDSIYLMYGSNSGVFGGQRWSSTDVPYPNQPIPGHPIPPYYDATGFPVECDADGSTPTLDRCIWSPFPSFYPGDAAWVRALATTLGALSDALGEGNVAVFSTDGPDLDLPAGEWPFTGDGVTDPLQHLGLDRDGDFIDVHCDGQRCDPDLAKHTDSGRPTHRVALRPIGELGTKLDTYGAILLLGDNTTTTFAEDSANLLRMSFTPPSAAARSTPTRAAGNAEGMDHHETLFAILQAAGQSGVRVVGAAGPAVGTLGLSGAATGAGLATDALPPNVGSNANPAAQFRLRCALERASPGSGQNQAPKDPDQNDHTVQPNARCMRSAGPGWAVDWNSGYNYEYIAHRDAQSMAVTDFVVRGGATPVPGVDAFNNCPPWNNNPSCTPIIVPPAGDVVTSSPTGDQTFITMRSTIRASDASASQALTQRTATWISAVLQALEPDASLPPGTDTWQQLDTAYGAPVGGGFVRGQDGSDRFDGKPIQFRLVVRSTPDDRGHDGVLVDRVDFYGTPRTSDLGVRIIEPRDLADYTPGDRFVAAVEVSNRGTEPIQDDAIVEIQATQDRFCPNAPASCPAPAADLAPRTLIVDGPIPAGAQYVVPVGGKHSDIRLPYLEYLTAHPLVEYADGSGLQPFFGDPFFHRDPALDRNQHDAAFTFTATLAPPPTDEESIDDVDTVRAFGRQVLDLPLVKDPSDVFVTPNEATYDETDSIEVGVRLTNHGSNRLQQALITYEVRHADPYHCYERRGARASDVFHRCQDNGLHVQAPFLTNMDVQGPITELVPHGTTKEYRYPIDLAAAGIGPGVYRLQVNVTTVDADGIPLTALTETFDRWVHLAAPSVKPDGGLAASGDDLSAVAGNTSQLADQDTQDAWLAFQSRAGNANQGSTCGADTSTRDNQNTNNVLLHGWKMGDDGTDACATGLNIAPDDAPTLEWRRSVQSTTGTCGNQACPINTGMQDFGPDWVLWDPHCEGQVISGGGNNYGRGGPIPPGPIPCGGTAQVPATNEPNGIPLSLATFEEPVLTFDTRYQAAPMTGYLVEMRLPVLACSGKPPFTTLISGCSWVWNWQNDTVEWFPLVSAETTNPHPVTRQQQQSTGQDQLGRPTFSRLVSNPAAGLPGIWGATTETGDNDGPDGGWKTMRFQVDLNAQAHTVRDFRNPTQGNPTPRYTLHRSLADYCQTIQGAAMGDEFYNSMGWWNAVNPGSAIRPLPDLEGCRYYQGEGGNIPRPVQFRFRAASAGAEQGVNFWKIRDVHLTEHHLTVEGSDTIPVEMQDGEIRIIPVRVRNDGSVDDHVQLVRHFDDDPMPPVCGSGDEGDLTMEFGIRGGFSKRPTDDPQPSVDVVVPRDSSRVVWFHLDVGLDTGAVPHLPYPIPIVVEACSLRDPLESTRVLIDATYTAREWGDLVVAEAKFSSDAAGFSDTGGVVHAAEKVPLDVVVKVSNQGHKAVGGPQAPVPVRLVVDRLDETGGVVETFVADSKSVDEEIGTCVTCGRYATLQWIPDSVGPYMASVEVNRPAVVPENIPDNNRLDPRFVQVGRVPLPDLDITDAALVPFHAQSGCAGLDESVDRALQGHSYCIAAVVENLGPTCALDPVVEFRIDADLFSTRRDPLLPACFPAEDEMVVHSAPWQAVTPLTSDLTWRFFVDADSKQESNLTNNQHDFRLRVDRIRLEVPDDPIDVALLPGAQTILKVDLTNSGTAPATPVALVEGGNESVRVHAVQPPPLQVGETTTVEVVVAASRSIAQGAQVPDVVISTREDANTHVVLPLRLNVSTVDAPQAAVLPLRSVPGAANATVVLDNAMHPAPLRWSLVSAAAPLQPDGTLDVEVDAYGRELAVLPLAVAPHTPPGFHEATVRLRAQTPSGHALEFDVPVPLVVEAQAGFRSSIDPDTQRVPRGLPGSMQAAVQNTGNIPLDVRWNATVDSGTVFLDHHVATIGPGAEHPIFMDVENGQALRSVGELRLHWRNATEGAWQDGGMHRWSITFPPHAVEISSTDLASLKVRPGANEVAATLTNPLPDPVEAEVLLIVDDQVHDRAVAEVLAGRTSRVELTFSAGSDGSGHDVLVVARPVGTAFTLQDDAFYDVGDARSRHVEVADDGGTLGIPGPAVGAVLLAVAAAVALRRRRS